ncbi:uncharacterized protein BDR25DRAFT_354355 [Lindgomyces ingoldianus]|uniref:Uncharacterized protein n=1 Tax=Lindgomyces ingoldianus TaxID=673940 RepID=A0ACB6QZ50_9PLEO|nr:uncharacterized protein BDR25DRAFT_354355 [Lindgomyces ingoldianus]KAF2471848.1 hypothetical protein BDR25DRAFT_354355 [Lindgomyces ingoldianus]
MELKSFLVIGKPNKTRHLVTSYPRKVTDAPVTIITYVLKMIAYQWASPVPFIITCGRGWGKYEGRVPGETCKQPLFIDIDEISVGNFQRAKAQMIIIRCARNERRAAYQEYSNLRMPFRDREFGVVLIRPTEDNIEGIVCDQTDVQAEFSFLERAKVEAYFENEGRYHPTPVSMPADPKSFWTQR